MFLAGNAGNVRQEKHSPTIARFARESKLAGIEKGRTKPTSDTEPAEDAVDPPRACAR